MPMRDTRAVIWMPVDIPLWLSIRTEFAFLPIVWTDDLTHGIHQVMMLLAPFLRDAERLHLNNLAQAYIR